MAEIRNDEIPPLKPLNNCSFCIDPISHPQIVWFGQVSGRRRYQRFGFYYYYFDSKSQLCICKLCLFEIIDRAKYFIMFRGDGS